MKDVYGMQYRRGVQLTEQQKADIAAQKQTAAGNISGAFGTVTSGAMMMAGGRGGVDRTSDAYLNANQTYQS